MAVISTDDTPVRICLTPTRNEAWIIKDFVKAAQSWASHIVVADQGSTDETVSYVKSSPKVILVKNPSPTYEESERQRILLDRARAIHGKRIIFGLDADEAFSSNSADSPEWERIEAAPPGTVLRLRWANVLPGFEVAWTQSRFIPFGYVDDGIKHAGKRIHSPRVPQPEGAPTLDIEDFVVLHFQYVLWDRMRSKQRWYQVWEHSEHKVKSPLQIFREYNHMNGSWDPDELHRIPAKWLDGFAANGADFRSLKKEAVTWWDTEVALAIKRRGADHFSKLAIWDKDWTELASPLGIDRQVLADPRSIIQKLIHRLLAASQARRTSLWVRAFERILRTNGW